VVSVVSGEDVFDHVSLHVGQPHVATGVAEGEGAFVPQLAVMDGLVLAFVGLGYLIFFIRYILVTIQAACTRD
jgi:uncharacterized membrane protein